MDPTPHFPVEQCLTLHGFDGFAIEGDQRTVRELRDGAGPS